MFLRSHAQKYIPGVYLHICKLYTCVNLAHANWTLDSPIPDTSTVATNMTESCHKKTCLLHNARTN